MLLHQQKMLTTPKVTSCQGILGVVVLSTNVLWNCATLGKAKRCVNIIFVQKGRINHATYR